MRPIRVVQLVSSYQTGGGEKVALALARGISAALNGEVAPPPQESWRPFEMETVIDQYVRIMTGR